MIPESLKPFTLVAETNNVNNAFLFLLLIISSCAAPLRAPSSEESLPIDIIFDLDWTLVKQVDALGEDPSKFIQVHDEFYRIGDGTRELLEFLFSKKNIRVSFFSGGKYDRNSSLLKKVHTRFGSAFDNAYKVLSYTDLTEVSTDKTLPFSERFKKDISLVNMDLSRVLLVDDDKRFLLNKVQTRNFLWLGETYKHYETFPSVPINDDVYVPKTKSKWEYDRRKLYMVKDLLEEVLGSEDNFLDSVENISSKWNFEKNQYTIIQKNSLRKLNGSSCSDYMQTFLIN